MTLAPDRGQALPRTAIAAAHGSSSLAAARSTRSRARRAGR
jgi:hypothetical protein